MLTQLENAGLLCKGWHNGKLLVTWCPGRPVWDFAGELGQGKGADDACDLTNGSRGQKVAFSGNVSSIALSLLSAVYPALSKV